MEVDMGRRLVMGTVSRQRLNGLYPLGVVNGREVFPIHGAEDDSDDDSADTSDDTDDDDDSDDDDGDDPEKSKRPAARTRQRSSEFNRIKRERNTLLKEKAARDKADREAELKGKSEVERVTAERDDTAKERDELKSRLATVAVELEIIKASNNSKYSWNDIEDVLNDKTLRAACEVGEDGEISGVAEALKDLAKRKPHFLATKSEEDKGEKNANGQQKAGTGAGGAGTNGNGKTGGNPSTGTNNDNLAAQRAQLEQTYPILARMPK